MLCLRVLVSSVVLSGLMLAIGSSLALAEPNAEVLAAKGDVSSRGPRDKSYAPVTKGAMVLAGSRVRTGDTGEATIKLPDGTETLLRPKTEIIVRPRALGDSEPSAITLFFGRVWSKAAKAVGGQESFEVRSANAVAGVRGTKFEVGVADDGATRVVVSEGAVGVAGEDDKSDVEVGAGYEVEGDSAGSLAAKKKAEDDPDWEGWFTKRARALEKTGLKVAKSLDGRLNQRRAKVEKLVSEQRALRGAIEALERKKKAGQDVDGALAETLAKLERVTARLEDMRARLEGAFGLFERWGALARTGRLEGGEDIARMSDDIAKIAADFADMIEEGTDQSEEGMEDMMKEMRDVKDAAKKQRPKKTAGDELF